MLLTRGTEKRKFLLRQTQAYISLESSVSEGEHVLQSLPPPPLCQKNKTKKTSDDFCSCGQSGYGVLLCSPIVEL